MRLKRTISALLMAAAVAGCQWLVPGASPDPQSPEASTPVLPGQESRAPRLSPTPEIPPPID